MAHADLELLLDVALPFAQKMLKKHGEYFPYGNSMSMTGEIKDVGAFDGDEHPASADVIAMLRNAFQSQAKNGEIRASSICYDSRVIPPGSASKSDAIALALDHEICNRFCTIQERLVRQIYLCSYFYFQGREPDLAMLLTSRSTRTQPWVAAVML